MAPITLLLFDGNCALCNEAVKFVLRHDLRERYKFAALQSVAGLRLVRQYNLPEDISSMVLIDAEMVYTRSDAALRVALHLRCPFPALWILMLVPRFIRDAVYDAIARHRVRWFGKVQDCLVLESFAHRIISEGSMPYGLPSLTSHEGSLTHNAKL